MAATDKLQGFHVGAHKTGTSLVQQHLERHPEDYRDHGLEFLTRTEMSGLASWGNALIDRPELLRQRVQRFRADPAHQTLFGSYENLIGRPFLTGEPGLYPRARRNLTALAEITGTDLPTKVFLSIRRQSQFIESYYLQAVHEGSALTFDQWLAQVDLSRLSWRPIVSAMVELFGEDNVEVVDFGLVKAGQGRYIGRFMRVLDPRFDDSVDPPARYNRSVSELGLRMALAANPHLNKGEERGQLRKFLQRNFSNVRYPRPTLLAPEQAAALDEHYAEEFDQLRQMNSFDRGLIGLNTPAAS